MHRARRRTIAPPAEVLPRWRRGLEADVPAVVRDLMLPESLVKRLVNHAPPEDVTEGYAADWTHDELREGSQRIADRVEALAFAEQPVIWATTLRCEGDPAR